MKTRKELQEEYKQKKALIGVFQVQNTVSKKILIEGSTNITTKWNRHRTELRFGSHRNKELQNDWNDLGEDSFKFSVISELEFDKDKDIDLNEELQLLKEMVVEELKIKDGMTY